MPTKKKPAAVPPPSFAVEAAPAKKPGRKPLPDGERTQVVTMRLSPVARAKFEKLGGVEWLRQSIARARVPVTIEDAS